MWNVDTIKHLILNYIIKIVGLLYIQIYKFNLINYYGFTFGVEKLKKLL